jgi:hypothetical protein
VVRALKHQHCRSLHQDDPRRRKSDPNPLSPVKTNPLVETVLFNLFSTSLPRGTEGSNPAPSRGDRPFMCVVDGSLKICGIEDLRIADGSVMPWDHDRQHHGGPGDHWSAPPTDSLHLPNLILARPRVGCSL